MSLLTTKLFRIGVGGRSWILYIDTSHHPVISCENVSWTGQNASVDHGWWRHFWLMRHKPLATFGFLTLFINVLHASGIIWKVLILQNKKTELRYIALFAICTYPWWFAEDNVCCSWRHSMWNYRAQLFFECLHAFLWESQLSDGLLKAMHAAIGNIARGTTKPSHPLKCLWLLSWESWISGEWERTKRGARIAQMIFSALGTFICTFE